MMTPEAKIEKIKEFISHVYNVFEKRPGMLGKPTELPPMLWVVDCVNEILREDTVRQEKNDRTWEDFLIEKKLLIGAENKLTKILLDDDFEFSYLQELRREYCEWREKP
jgi:hypothetical protein